MPAQRVRESADGMSIDLAGRLLRFLDTPGMRATTTASGTGTRASSPATPSACPTASSTPTKGPWLLPTTTPVQFEPDKLRESVQRLLAYQPECMYLTHYSRVRDVQRLGASLLEQLARLVAIGRPEECARSARGSQARAAGRVRGDHGRARLSLLRGRADPAARRRPRAQRPGHGRVAGQGSLNVSAVNFGLTGRAAIVTGAAQA